jgi:hypothetical protein
LLLEPVLVQFFHPQPSTDCVYSFVLIVIDSADEIKKSSRLAKARAGIGKDQRNRSIPDFYKQMRNKTQIIVNQTKNFFVPHRIKVKNQK